MALGRYRRHGSSWIHPKESEVELAILLACQQGDVHSPAGTTGFRLAPGSLVGRILPESLAGWSITPLLGSLPS